MNGSSLAVAPILVPLATALVATLLAAHPRLQKIASFAGSLALVGCAVALVGRAVDGQPASLLLGGWPHPFAIEFRVDRVGASLVLVSAVLGLACLAYQEGYDRGDRSQPYLLPLVHGLLAGVGGSFSTADLFNLYVWFEVMLICSVGLMAIGRTPARLDATFRYLVLNLFGTMILLAGVAAVYAVTGHLNYDALAARSASLAPGLRVLLLSVLVTAFLVKSAAFPFFNWLPASYHTLPAPILALFAGLLTKVGVYAILRVTGSVLAPTPDDFKTVLGWMAVATMVAGVLGAAHHWDLRRILSFHIISQIGYILLAIALEGPAGSAAALLYTLHHIVVKANLFLLAGLIFRLAGSYDLRRIGGLYADRPAFALLFAVPALSLVGLPPLSGFWAKFFVIRETLVQGHYAWAAAALVVSVLTLYSMLKVWIEAFWKPHPGAALSLGDDADAAPRVGASAYAAVLGLAAITLAIGLFPALLVDFTNAAAAAIAGRTP